LLIEQFKPADEDLKAQSDAQFMQEIIDQRKVDIDNIGSIMGNINSMAKDMAIEVKV
jgi:hypothetical protein